jgi:hypothetical protein
MVHPKDVLGFMYSGAAIILGVVLMFFGCGFQYTAIYPDINSKELKYTEDQEIKLKNNRNIKVYDRRSTSKNCKRACRGSMNPCCWVFPT